MRPVTELQIENGALIEAAQRGDGEALDALLTQYQAQIYRFGLRMCRNPQDAQDVLQETLLAAARTLPGFRRASSVSTWLYAIARSFCLKQRRRGLSRRVLISLASKAGSLPVIVDSAPNPERRLVNRELGDALQAAIEELAPRYREVLLLRDVEGLAASDVAAVTRLSVAAVKSRLHRARAMVRLRLDPLLMPTIPAAPGLGVCPDVVGLLSRYLESDIDRGGCTDVESHVSGCARCQAACDSLRQTLRLCGATPLPEVPKDLQDSIQRGLRALLAPSRALSGRAARARTP